MTDDDSRDRTPPAHADDARDRIIVPQPPPDAIDFAELNAELATVRFAPAAADPEPASAAPPARSTSSSRT
jgi:hypothetical protein